MDSVSNLKADEQTLSLPLKGGRSLRRALLNHSTPPNELALGRLTAAEREITVGSSHKANQEYSHGR